MGHPGFFSAGGQFLVLVLYTPPFAGVEGGVGYRTNRITLV